MKEEGVTGYTLPMTITIDIPPDVADRLTRKAADEGRDVAGYVRHLALRETEAEGDGAQPTPRTPGLHAGRYWIAEDFDAPLPDGFWLGTDGEAAR